MNSLKASILVAFLSAVVLSPRPAMAMLFSQFDHMSNEDRQNYLNLLVDAAQQVLIQQRHTADADRIHRLFTDIRRGDQMPIGVAELELNLDSARVHDANRAIQSPNAPRMQIETALAMTLQKNGIRITPEFMQGVTAA